MKQQHRTTYNNKRVINYQTRTNSQENQVKHNNNIHKNERKKEKRIIPLCKKNKIDGYTIEMLMMKNKGK